MTPLETLRKRLQIHNRDCQDIPAESFQEAERRHLQGLALQLQIECEEWRHQIQLSFYMCKLKTVVEVYDNLEIEKTRTVFKWEDFRDTQLSTIAEKEIKGIEYIQQLIKHTYMSNKQKFEAGLRFRIPGSDLVYKQTADHYGNNHIAFLNSGVWEYSTTITSITDDCLICPDGDGQKELPFESMDFVSP